MKNLKFRVWSKTLERFLSKEEYLLDFNGKLMLIEMIDWNMTLFPVLEEHYEIQQGTGLTDKNDKEIYEGDIVKGKDEFGKKTYAGIIHWNHSYWAIGAYKLFIMDDDSLQILGNKYENPEMLEQ